MQDTNAGGDEFRMISSISALRPVKYWINSIQKENSAGKKISQAV